MARNYYQPGLQPAPHPYLGMSFANTPVLVISRPMPQRPQRPQRRPPRTRTSSNARKRHGMVFTSDPLRGMLEEGDDESTWSMSRSRWSRRMATSASVNANVRNRNTSPAQEIAARYRASHSSDERPRTRASSSVTYLDMPSADTLSRGTSMDTELSDVSGPRLRFRESRVTAMDQASREAYVMAIRWGRDRDIPCRRIGCRDVLPDIRSLATHITIHDIDPRERYVPQPRYHSFLDLGHTVDGRQTRRYAPSHSPYVRSLRARSKLRKYLSMLTCRCISCHAHQDNFFDDF